MSTRVQTAIEAEIRRRAATDPSGVWLRWKDDAYTWSQVVSFTQRAANGLLEHGVQPGDRVALMMANCPEFLWLHFGALAIGAQSVPVNISQRGATLQHILVDSESTAVVFDEDLFDAVDMVRSQVTGPLRTIVAGGRVRTGVDSTVDRVLSAADTEPQVELAAATGGVGMMYTSGTTGPPKGVVTDRYDTSPVSLLLDAAGVREGDTIYTALPLFHGNALFVSAVGSIFAGASLALAPKFSASRFWDDCRRYGAVEFNTLGGMISILLKQPPRTDDREHQVRSVLSAGCPREAWEVFEQRFGVRILEWFGMVDSPGFLLNTDGPVGSMGRPIADVEFKVVDDDGNEVRPGETGELVFRHPLGRLTHYKGLADATDRAYRGGWFHTGDLARCDDDGNYYYGGRKTESIRRLGENISAWEIESVVNGHPAVLESAAHSVPSPLGEDEVKICIVPQPGQEIDPVAILDYCQGRMAHYAVPRYVEVMDSLPKTETQRMQYKTLKARGIGENAWDRESVGYVVRRGGVAVGDQAPPTIAT